MARNVQFNFAPDEYILCFEPDVTKARVLYNAKVDWRQRGNILVQ